MESTPHVMLIVCLMAALIMVDSDEQIGASKRGKRRFLFDYTRAFYLHFHPHTSMCAGRSTLAMFGWVTKKKKKRRKQNPTRLNS